MITSEFLTPAQVAEQLKVSKASVLKWVKDGSLAAHRLSKRTILIKDSDLREFVDARRTSVGAPPAYVSADEIDDADTSIGFDDESDTDTDTK